MTSSDIVAMRHDRHSWVTPSLVGSLAHIAEEGHILLELEQHQAWPELLRTVYLHETAGYDDRLHSNLGP
jgi:hypothetical protein